MFFGDALLTPAVSVLSAVEGLSVIPELTGKVEPFILPIALVILVGLFLIQKRGTSAVGKLFGPVCLVVLAIGTLAVYVPVRTLTRIDPLTALRSE